MKKFTLAFLALALVLGLPAAVLAGEDALPRTIGVAVRPVAADEAKKLGLGEVKCLLVEGVKMDSAAAMSGIAENDVITAVDGKPVSTPEEFSAALDASGTRLRVTIFRNGWEKECVIKFDSPAKQERKQPGERANDRAKLIKEIKRIIAEHEAEAARLKKLLEEIEKKPADRTPETETPEKTGPAPKDPAGKTEETPKTKRGAAYLGIGVESSDQGLRITEIDENSPAAKARLKIGDVLAAAGDAKLDGLDGLKKILAEAAPGDAVDFSIIRNGQPAKVMVILGARPDESSETEKTPQAQPPSPPRLGISVEITDSGEIAVTGIEENSPAARAGLKPGDVLIEAVGIKLATLADIRKALEKAASSGTIELIIRRGEGELRLKADLTGK